MSYAHAVLFDFDYTLADSSRGALECIGYALESCGLPVPEEQVILSTIGMSLDDTFALLSPGGCVERLKDLFIERADQVMADSIQLYDGVPELMSALKGRGYGVGIVSTKFRRRIESVLRRDGIFHLVDVIVGGEDVTNHKPHPEGLEKAIEKLGCGKELVAYVGDSLVDAKTAASAGVRFIGLAMGTTPGDELSRHGAVAVADNPTGLLNLLPLVKS